MKHMIIYEDWNWINSIKWYGKIYSYQFDLLCIVSPEDDPFSYLTIGNKYKLYFNDENDEYIIINNYQINKHVCELGDGLWGWRWANIPHPIFTEDDTMEEYNKRMLKINREKRFGL